MLMHGALVDLVWINRLISHFEEPEKPLIYKGFVNFSAQNYAKPIDAGESARSN